MIWRCSSILSGNGTPTDNLEQAISYYEQALMVRTRQNYPDDYRALHERLARCYKLRTFGECTMNQRQAIRHYLQLLEYLSRDKDPQKWASVHGELLELYYHSSRGGDRAETIEQAIYHGQQALQVYTPESTPSDWVWVQNWLASAYAERIVGDQQQNLQQAIAYYSANLELIDRQARPRDWAVTQINMADAYADHVRQIQAVDLERAIYHYQQALALLTPETYPAEWAGAQWHLGKAYLDSAYTDREQSLEHAISHLTTALAQFRSQSTPREWFTVHNLLAMAYGLRVQGDPGENLELSISHLEAALAGLDPRDDPDNWAIIHTNLAKAYELRRRGSRAENIERSISHCQQALAVCSLEQYSDNWAEVQLTLAIAYRYRILDSPLANIEHAIEHYNQALAVYTQPHAPDKWAMIHNNLGEVYRIRLAGDRTENIERAILHYEIALRVRTRAAQPEKWAMTKSNLGLAYIERLRGDLSQNIEQAISQYHEALEVYTRSAYCEHWGVIEHNLGYAYSKRLAGSKADNIEQAIQHYEHALEVRTRTNLPEKWAMTLLDLGNAHMEREYGDHAENIRQAIRCYEDALQVYTFQAFPTSWATIQYQLGLIYSRYLGNTPAMSERAANYYQAALRVYQPEVTPHLCRLASGQLANLFFSQRNWPSALAAYQTAMVAGEQIYRAGLSVESKTSEIAENARFYRHAAYAAVQAGELAQALSILDSGKTRLLADTLRLRIRRPDAVPDDVWIHYQESVAVYRETQAMGQPLRDSANQITNSFSNIDQQELTEHYALLEQRQRVANESMNSAIGQVRQFVPGFLADSDLATWRAALPDASMALVAFCMTDQGSVALIVTHEGVVHVDIPSFTESNLTQLLFGEMLDQTGVRGGWVRSYYSNKAHWYDSMDATLARVGADLLAPVVAMLPPTIKHLIMLPSGGLYLLPLHAALLPDSAQTRLCDRYQVSYAPSVKVLATCYVRASHANGQALFAVINPQEDSNLAYSPIEGLAISELFSTHRIFNGRLGQKETVKTETKQCTYLHFSCHGIYDRNDPSTSGLALADSRLTLAELQQEIVDLSAARLVTLSACETGLSDAHGELAEEYIGLPAGFLTAGVPCVVSSLWSVPDISTALLMEQFYLNHHRDGMSIIEALHSAQKWLREMNIRDVVRYVDKAYQQARQSGVTKETEILLWTDRRQYSRLAEQDSTSSPFAHPYYWAAFTVSGV
ncbi:CHAT domain-containing protein [Candidatus Oscillochloris fontis]|uniref:CHAT domain-containing protein n=1 Tax=Candidatus Oscillochloris fontis TaxID=2496868 RepID=UPI00101C6C26|nr:CHAT domain-containing tetratricopeptide repeat protein [Candidatus Oscillochloris fontis]